MKKFRRLLVTLLIVILSLSVLLVIFISPITKYLIEKYSVEYTGRQIRMDKLALNVFNGHITARGLRIYEPDGKTEFISCARLAGNIAMYKLWAGKYDVTELAAEQPVLHIVQNGERFNYDDLMKRFLSDTTPPDPKQKPMQFWVRNIHLDSARIVYENKHPYAKLSLVSLNAKLPLVAWNDSLYRIHADFDLASGGHFNGDIQINANSFRYELALDMKQLNIGWMYPYLRDYMKVKSLDGFISSKLLITGNFNRPTDIAASGMLFAENFSIVDETNDNLTAIEELSMKVDTINTAKNMFNFSTIHIARPYFKLSMYDQGFNYERIMTTPFDSDGDSSVQYANIFLMMAGYIQDIVKQYDVNNYKIGKLSVTGGRCVFSDFTHGDKFRYVLDSLNMNSDRLNSNNPQLVFDVKARLNTSGKMKGVLKVDPKNYRDIDIDAEVRDMLMSDFNPYTKYYVATPFLDGRITYVNRTIVQDGKLDSKNVLDIRKLTAGKKIKNISTAMNLPVRLAVSLLKDVKGNIHIDIPVKGTLNDPEFKWGRVVWSVVKNLIIKAATAPFRLLAGLFGGREEDYKDIRFEYMQSAINADQQKQLDQLARVASEKPELKIELVQVTNKEDEAEEIALAEMKRRYLQLPAEGIAMVDLKRRTDSVSNNDSLFVRFIHARLPGASGLQSTQEKCVQLIGAGTLASRVAASMESRNKLVTEYLIAQKNIPAGRISIINAKETDQLQKSEPPKYVINVAAED